MEATMQLWFKQTFTKMDSTNVLQTENSFYAMDIISIVFKVLKSQVMIRTMLFKY
jgi:hypothetical protein